MKNVTMHIIPDYNAVLNLGAASGWVETMCGKVKVAMGDVQRKV